MGAKGKELDKHSYLGSTDKRAQQNSRDQDGFAVSQIQSPILSVSLQAFLVGIVVPDAEILPAWAKKRGFDGTFAELCKNAVNCLCTCSCAIQCQFGLCVCEQTNIDYNSNW